MDKIVIKKVLKQDLPVEEESGELEEELPKGDGEESAEEESGPEEEIPTEEEY